MSSSSTVTTAPTTTTAVNEFTKGSRLYIYITSVLPFIIGIVFIIYALYHILKKESIYDIPDGSILVNEARVLNFVCGSSAMAHSCTVTVEYTVDTLRYVASANTSETFKINEDIMICVDRNHHEVITRVGTIPTVNPYVALFIGIGIMLFVIVNVFLVSKSSTLANVEGAVSLANIISR